jgi:hypothetical protein
MLRRRKGKAILEFYQQFACVGVEAVVAAAVAAMSYLHNTVATITSLTVQQFLCMYIHFPT